MKHVWHCVVVMAGMLTVVTLHASDRKQVKKCLRSDRKNELHISCDRGQVISVKQAVHGYVNTTTCDVDESQCTEKVTNLDYVNRGCAARQNCSRTFSSMFLNQCGERSNYVLITYHCIKDNSADPYNMLDVCGTNSDHKWIRRKHGYITSVNYPRHYPPDTICTCNLTTDSAAHIILHVLDMSLDTMTGDNWHSDWLEYASSEQQWGDGWLLQRAAPYERVHTGKSTVLVNFRSDHRNELRGFWISYEGVGTDGASAIVSIQCDKFKPSAYKKHTVCFSKTHPDEVYLSCQSLGLIDVLHVRSGHHVTHTDTACHIPDDSCHVDMSGDSSLLDVCMGKETCHVPVEAVTLTSCLGQPFSSYLSVEYQCIADSQKHWNIVDICGEMLNGEIAERSVGYIKSLNYPHAYSPDTNCSCSLHASDSDAIIVFSIIDRKLARDDTKTGCDGDWLRYRDVTETWSSGSSLNNVRLRQNVMTSGSHIMLDFHADSDNEDRGFWLQYTATRPDGFKSRVDLQCRNVPYRPCPPVSERYDTTEVTPSDQNSTNQDKKHSVGMIAGIVCGMVVAVVAIITIGICKHRRKHLLMWSEDHVQSPLDTEHKSRNYQTMNDEENRPSVREPTPDYDTVSYVKTPTRFAGSHTSSYVNPAFNGGLDTSQTTHT